MDALIGLLALFVIIAALVLAGVTVVLLASALCNLDSDGIPKKYREQE